VIVEGRRAGSAWRMAEGGGQESMGHSAESRAHGAESMGQTGQGGRRTEGRGQGAERGAPRTLNL